MHQVCEVAASDVETHVGHGVAGEGDERRQEARVEVLVRDRPLLQQATAQLGEAGTVVVVAVVDVVVMVVVMEVVVVLVDIVEVELMVAEK